MGGWKYIRLQATRKITISGPCEGQRYAGNKEGEQEPFSFCDKQTGSSHRFFSGLGQLSSQVELRPGLAQSCDLASA